MKMEVLGQCIVKAVVLAIVLSCGCCKSDVGRPNIVIIIADDLGWNDVGFHGCNQVRTPNIDALAYAGLPLQNYYVTPICTPSRAALMTGKYPIHTGMQHTVLFAMEPRGLPLSEKLLPQYLKELGYSTHLVGKWHLGFHRKQYLPMNRGFDTHMGFWSGRIDHYDHTSMENGTWGFDFRRGFEVAHDLFGKFATDVYTDEAVKVIRNHNATKPLFLTVGHSAMHSGNPNDPIRAPHQVVANFTHIDNLQRRKYVALLSKLDESVGKVTAALQQRGLLSNTIILFTTDNGGAAEGFNDNAGSNYPLRGVKNTLWEGGVKAAGFLWSPLIGTPRVAKQRIHIVDWLPTLYRAAGGNLSVFENIDGIDQWESLTRNLTSERTTLVHNIDDIWGSAAITVDQWKLHKGTNYKGTWDQWYGPGGLDGSYDLDEVFASDAARALATSMPTRDTATLLRKEATIECGSVTRVKCEPLKAPCLFNIEQDPCELRNLAEENPEVLQIMLAKLEEVNRTAARPGNLPLDSRGDPKYWGRVYTTFVDFERPQPCA